MRRLLPTALVVLAALAAPAAAIDLTGRWSQKSHQTCTGLTADGVKVKIGSHESSFGDLPITQSGSALYMRIDGYIWHFQGHVYQDPGGSKGQAILQKCPGGVPDPDPFATYRVTKAETFPVNSKGVSGKMTTLYVYGSAEETFSCIIVWERTSLVDPEASPCN